MTLDEWIQNRGGTVEARQLSDWRVLGRSLQGIVSWNMNDTCNYRCTYCTQRNMADRTGVLSDAERETMLQSFSHLPGSWEIKLSGGEPFLQPGLDDIVRGLVQLGHCISIQTNFSVSRKRVESFLEATRGALHLFSASLHLDYDTPESFVERYSWIRPYEPFGVRFHVTSVGVPDRLRQLHDHVAPLLKKHGIPLKVQPEKIDGYVRDYSPQEQELLLAMGGHNLTGQIAHNFQGRLCHAGANYLVIKSTGVASRCYPASRIGGRYADRGSLQHGLNLLDGPKLCPYTYCNCTVPIQRGMIDGIPVSQPGWELDEIGD